MPKHANKQNSKSTQVKTTPTPGGTLQIQKVEEKQL